MPKKNKTQTGTYVTMSEIIEMKAYKLQDLPISQIAQKTSRNRKTVERSLALFEQMLPDSVDMKNKVLAKVDEMTEQMMKNAKTICLAADLQVMRKIDTEETTAIEAAKIRQIYGGDLMRMLGVAGHGEVDDSDHSPRVQNFITTIINIQQPKKKDDRLEKTTGVAQAARENVDGGEKACVEGIVST